MSVRENGGGLPFPWFVLLCSGLQIIFGIYLAIKGQAWFMSGLCVGFGGTSMITVLMVWASPVGRNYRP